MTQYLFANDPGFGPISWILLLVWTLGLLGGVYLYQSWREANPIRARFVHQTGLGLAIISAAGLIVLALKALGIPVVSQRVWTYVAFGAMLLFLGYALWFSSQRLPRLLEATRAAGRNRVVTRAGGARTYGVRNSGGSSGRSAGRPAQSGGTAGEASPATPKPVATTTRREARRDKKRRGR